MDADWRLRLRLRRKSAASGSHRTRLCRARRLCCKAVAAAAPRYMRASSCCAVEAPGIGRECWHCPVRACRQRRSMLCRTAVCRAAGCRMNSTHGSATCCTLRAAPRLSPAASLQPARETVMGVARDTYRYWRDVTCPTTGAIVDTKQLPCANVNNQMQSTSRILPAADLASHGKLDVKGVSSTRLSDEGRPMIAALSVASLTNDAMRIIVQQSCNANATHGNDLSSHIHLPCVLTADPCRRYLMDPWRCKQSSSRTMPPRESFR